MTVKKGYAISCEGDDIRIERDETIDLFDLIAREIGLPTSPPGLPLTMPDSEACLILDSNPSSANHYHVEPASAHPTGFKGLLQGTLLLDFFEECIQSLIDFFKDEFTPKPGEENLPVGPAQKRLTTFSNLLIELINTQNGAFVFLSGEQAESGSNFEHTILREFYTKLRQKLQSHTFCAMFDGARQFPDYPYQNPGITTIFGKGLKTRLRIAPNSKVAYTAGGGTTINVFDLVKGEMTAELTFPGGPNAVVQDVAVSRDGRELYATAIINNRDTMFAIADISGGGLVHTFRANPTMICDQLLVTLGVSPAFDDVTRSRPARCAGLPDQPEERRPERDANVRVQRRRAPRVRLRRHDRVRHEVVGHHGHGHVRPRPPPPARRRRPDPAGVPAHVGRPATARDRRYRVR